MTQRRLPSALSLVVILTLLLAACGSADEPSATASPDAEETPAATGDSSPGGEETPEPEPVDVRIAQGATTLIYAPIYLAQSQGFFADEGVNVIVENVVGAAALQALSGGSVDFALTVSGTSLTAVAEGLDIVAIQATTDAVTLALVIRPDVAQERGLTPDLPLEERIAGLEGLNIGYTAPGAATDVYGRWLLEEAGLDPESDVNLVALGETSALVAALEQGQIDAFTASPPTVQQLEAAGDGLILVNMVTDVPETANFVYSILLASPEYLAENEDVARRLTRAISRGMNYLLDNPEDAKEALQADFNVEPDVLSAAVDSLMDAYPRDGRMTEEMWQRAIDLQVELGIVAEPLAAAEGVLWTNDYIE